MIGRRVFRQGARLRRTSRVSYDARGYRRRAHQIVVHLDDVLTRRGIDADRAGERVGVTISQSVVLKNGRARAIIFATLSAICRSSNCQPGDLLAYDEG